MIDSASLYSDLDSRYVNVTGDTMLGTLITRALVPDVALTRNIGSASVYYNNIFANNLELIQDITCRNIGCTYISVGASGITSSGIIVPTNDGTTDLGYLAQAWRDIRQTRYHYTGKVASLPTADSTYRGALIRVEGGVGSKDIVYLCKKKADETFAFLKLLDELDVLTDSQYPNAVLLDGSRIIAADLLSYYENPTSGLWALTRVGPKLPSDDPDNPGEAVPHLDLIPIQGAAAADEFRICTDPSDFCFAVKRRVLGAGSWVDAMKLDTTVSPIQWLFGASFLPTVNNSFDFGADSYRWRDIFIYRYLRLFGVVTLPTPTILINRCVTSRAVQPGEFDFVFQRSAGDYKWKNLVEQFTSVSLLKDVSGITVTDIGTVAVEILPVSFRSKVLLSPATNYSNFDRARVVFGGVNNEAVAFYCKIQYSTDQTTWTDLTPEGASDGTTTEQLVVGAWGNIPTGALADVFISAVGRAGSATADPTFKNIELQLR